MNDTNANTQLKAPVPLFDFPVGSRGDRATVEAHVRSLERLLSQTRAALSALPAELPLAAPGAEWPERALSAAVAGLAAGAPPYLLGLANTQACWLAGAIAALGTTLLGERARRMALGEMLPAAKAADMPGDAWWLLMSLLSGLLGWALAAGAGRGRAPVSDLVAGVLCASAAALGTAIASWWTVSRWHRHAVARLQLAKGAGEREALLLRISSLEAQKAAWLAAPQSTGFAPGQLAEAEGLN